MWSGPGGGVLKGGSTSIPTGREVYEGHLRQRNSSYKYCDLTDTPLHDGLPFLSPVSTQILMSAFASFEMVSGTPSCSLSSIAVAPKSWNRYLKNSISKVSLEAV